MEIDENDEKQNERKMTFQIRRKNGDLLHETDQA